MADDHRYDNDWLDDDAVERLLRGESVVAESAAVAGDGSDKSARIAAERLDAALKSLTGPLPDGPLPGEEAALAAFRRAHAAGAAPAVPHAAGPVAVLRSFLHRPAKAALALTLAGCAVGGVAVAAGTGVLPGPFGRAGKEPAPAASVTVAGGAETLAPGTPGPRATPSPGASGRGRTGGPDAHDTRRPGGTGTPDAPGGRTGEPGRSPSASPRDDGDTKGKGDSGDTSGDANARGGRAWAARICREFLTNGTQRGGVDDDEVRTLERNAGGPGAAAVRAYCERLLSALDATGGAGQGSGAGSAGSGSPALPRSRSRAHTVLPAPLPVPGVTLSDAAAL
ncbi:hypothetical protein AB0F13_00965 [Streptomyces sp. NPDC026206]|uniref:hypothetical protein n=1 Tax=Streptomyces sp. NPDC026206 TaxID=3157089 RepID=UPI0033E2E7A7